VIKIESPDSEAAHEAEIAVGKVTVDFRTTA